MDSLFVKAGIGIPAMHVRELRWYRKDMEKNGRAEKGLFFLEGGAYWTWKSGFAEVLFVW